MYSHSKISKYYLNVISLFVVVVPEQMVVLILKNDFYKHFGQKPVDVVCNWFHSLDHSLPIGESVL